MTGGTPPDSADGFNYNMSDLFRQVATVDVDAALKGDADWKKARAALYPDIATGFTWKSKLFAVPIYNSFFSLYYQPDFLKRAGLAVPPLRGWSWDQFLDYCRKASRPPDITGCDAGWNYGMGGMFMLNNGAKFVSQDGTKFTFDSPRPSKRWSSCSRW